METLLLAVWAAFTPIAYGAEKKPEKSTISEDITIKSRPAGPGVEVAPPAASKAVVDEVLKSLSLGRGHVAHAPSRIGVEADIARVKAPFPEGPWLSFSAENVAALYDHWTFEVLDDRERILYSERGVGALKQRIDWHGTGGEAGFVLETGRAYRYRFTGQRGDRSFVVESEPLPIASFSHVEYAGNTRLEAALPLVFDSGKASFSKDAPRWLEQFSSKFRLSEPRPDGTYKLELAMKDPHSELANKRAKALSARLARSLVVNKKKVIVERVPAPRGESVAAILPPGRGAPLRIE